MENIFQILNYSFTPLDISGYFHHFILQRKKDMDRLSIVYEAKFRNYDKPDVIAAVICELYLREPISIPDLSQGFHTFEFLGAIMQELSQNRISSGKSNIIDLLQKKFEVKHRVVDLYDSQLRENSKIYYSVPVYTLFALVLGLRYLMQRNLNDFNTTVKLHDLILKSGWPIETNFKPMISFSLGLEQLTMENLRGS